MSAAAEPTVIVVTVPIAPDRALLANNRSRAGGNWRPRHEATATLRQAAKGAGLNTRARWSAMGGGSIIRGPVEVEYLVRWPADRYKGQTKMPDVGELTVACKPILDGLCDARLIDGDDSGTVVRVSIAQEKGATSDGCVVVEVTAVSAGERKG